MRWTFKNQKGTVSPMTFWKGDDVLLASLLGYTTGHTKCLDFVIFQYKYNTNTPFNCPLPTTPPPLRIYMYNYGVGHILQEVSDLCSMIKLII